MPSSLLVNKMKEMNICRRKACLYIKTPMSKDILLFITLIKISCIICMINFKKTKWIQINFYNLNGEFGDHIFVFRRRAGNSRPIEMKTGCSEVYLLILTGWLSSHSIFPNVLTIVFFVIHKFWLPLLMSRHMLLRKKLSLRPIAYYHNLAIITVAGLTLINQWRK